MPFYSAMYVVPSLVSCGEELRPYDEDAADSADAYFYETVQVDFPEIRFPNGRGGERCLNIGPFPAGLSSGEHVSYLEKMFGKRLMKKLGFVRRGSNESDLILAIVSDRLEELVLGAYSEKQVEQAQMIGRSRVR